MCTSVSEPASSSLMPVAFVPSVQARPLCPVDIGCTARSSSPRCSRRASDYAYLHAHPGARPQSRGRDRSARSHQELAVGTAVERVARHAVISGGVHSLVRNAGLEIKLRDATPAPIKPPNSDSSAGMIGLLHRTRCSGNATFEADRFLDCSQTGRRCLPRTPRTPQPHHPLPRRRPVSPSGRLRRADRYQVWRPPTHAANDAQLSAMSVPTAIKRNPPGCPGGFLHVRGDTPRLLWSHDDPVVSRVPADT
jgi:hypothetical protein